MYPLLKCALISIGNLPQIYLRCFNRAVFGRKKNVHCRSSCKEGKGLVKANGCPLHLVTPEILRTKVHEPFMAIKLGNNPLPFDFSDLDIRVRVKGGGYSAQIYAIRQAIAKGIVTIKNLLTKVLNKLRQFLAIRSLLVADSRRTEPKKFGGPSARARYQKSYR